MRVTESLLRQNNLKNKSRNRYQEDDEPTQTYRKQKWEYWALNQNKTVFDSPLKDGLNSRKSVFDQQAVFQMKEGEE